MLAQARRLLLALAITTAAWFTTASVAEARFSGEVTYSYEQTWQAAVRMIRVDLQCPITDRDEELGFVLFEYRNAGRSYPGSLEVVRSTDGHGVEHVRVTVQVNAMPSYVERMVFERLTRKLRDDFGESRSRRRPQPPEETPPVASPPEEEPAPDAPQEQPPAASDGD